MGNPCVMYPFIYRKGFFMAYLLDCVVDSVEVRGVGGGTSKRGNQFKTVKCEDKEGRDFELSVTNDELISKVSSLKKGDIISARVLAVSTPKRSYIQLVGAPTVMGNSYEGGF